MEIDETGEAITLKMHLVSTTPTDNHYVEFIYSLLIESLTLWLILIRCFPSSHASPY
eukprot:m.132461 g.132461  ORF g.132461 m.132461 type:complete len:57 (-) comp9485_c0_seq4:2431-2601(-)